MPHLDYSQTIIVMVGVILAILAILYSFNELLKLVEGSRFTPLILTGDLELYISFMESGSLFSFIAHCSNFGRVACLNKALKTWCL